MRGSNSGSDSGIDASGRYRLARIAATRRQVLRGAALSATGLTSAWLLACGSSKSTSSSNGGTPSAKSANSNTSAAQQFQRAGVANTPVTGAAAAAKLQRSVGKRGGRMVGNIGAEPDSFDPHRDAGFPGVQVVNGVYSTLWRGYIPPGQSPIIEGDLVSSYEQPDNLTIVMHFPPGVKWQDQPPVNGRDFTSDDVKQNFARMATNQADFGLAPFLNMIKSVDTPDAQTAKVNFSTPYAPFILNMADGWPVVIPRELYNGDDAKTQAVGTGPFFIKRHDRGAGIYLDRNPTYFKKDTAGNQLPYMDGIDWLIIPDPSTSLSAFMTKKLDYRGISPTDEDKVKQALPDAQHAEAIGAPFLWDLNTQFQQLKDPRVRQAFMYAVDYDLVMKIGYLGLAVRGQPLSNSLRGYTLDSSELPQRDVQKAKQLLAAAGMPNGLDIEDWIPNNYVPDTGHTQIQQSVKDAGINVKFRITDWTPWRTGGYGIEDANPPLQTTSTAIFVFLNPDHQLWIGYHTGAANNNVRYSNPDFDKMLEDARAEFDQSKQEDLYKQAARKLFADVPSVFICESTGRTYWQSYLKNWSPDDGSTNFLQYKKFDYVYLDPVPSR